MTPRELFEANCRYLQANGWRRDGDDPGIWIRPGFAMPLGDALTVQFEADGVSMLEAVQSESEGQIQEAPVPGARVEASELSGTQKQLGAVPPEVATGTPSAEGADVCGGGQAPSLAASPDVLVDAREARAETSAVNQDDCMRAAHTEADALAERLTRTRMGGRCPTHGMFIGSRCPRCHFTGGHE